MANKLDRIEKDIQKVKLERSQKEDVNGKVQRLQLFSSEAADEENVHHTLSQEANPVQKQREIVHVRFPSP